MKPLILTLISLFAISAFADVEALDSETNDHRGGRGGRSAYCEVELVARNGAVIDSFVADSCSRALRHCNYELDRLHREGRNPYARCEVVGDNGGGYNPPPPHNPPPYNPPPYNPPPRYESWTCIANDQGTEEHYGGHAGSGNSQYEAAQNAINICKLSHGECYISTCSQGRY